ncbi:MAG TPA: hypothetical protein PK737_01935 [Bacilli bacterium]|nr:hypothetical protein [Bacilli bacterium]
MRTIKADLPAGVKKKFVIKLGHKVKLINKNMIKSNKKPITK